MVSILSRTARQALSFPQYELPSTLPVPIRDADDAQDEHPHNANPPNLFKPITIRNVTFPNRVFLVCMLAVALLHKY